MIDNETLNKIVQKKTLWAEIELKQELRALLRTQMNNQIKELEQAIINLSAEIKQKLIEFESVAQWLTEREYESLLCQQYKKNKSIIK